MDLLVVMNFCVAAAAWLQARSDRARRTAHIDRVSADLLAAFGPAGGRGIASFEAFGAATDLCRLLAARRDEEDDEKRAGWDLPVVSFAQIETLHCEASARGDADAIRCLTEALVLLDRRPCFVYKRAA